MVVVVTGTPGTGKSTFARMLSDSAGATVIEINDVAREQGLYSGRRWHGSREVRMGPLAKAVSSCVAKSRGLVVVVGHLAPDLGIRCNIAVVTRLGLRRLAERLEARRYHAEKVRENLISEALDYCGTAMQGLGGECYEIESMTEYRAMAAYIAKRHDGKMAAPPKLKEHGKMQDIMALVKDGNRYGL